VPVLDFDAVGREEPLDLSAPGLSIREHAAAHGLLVPGQIAADVAEELAVVYELLAWDDEEEVNEQLGVIPQDGGDAGAAGAGVGDGEVEVGVGVGGVGEEV